MLFLFFLLQHLWLRLKLLRCRCSLPPCHATDRTGPPKPQASPHYTTKRIPIFGVVSSHLGKVTSNSSIIYRECYKLSSNTEAAVHKQRSMNVSCPRKRTKISYKIVKRRWAPRDPRQTREHQWSLSIGGWPPHGTHCQKFSRYADTKSCRDTPDSVRGPQIYFLYQILAHGDRTASSRTSQKLWVYRMERVVSCRLSISVTFKGLLEPPTGALIAE